MSENKSGVDLEEFQSYDIPVHRVYVLTEEAAEQLKRPCGTYTTLTTGPLDELASTEQICSCLIEQLRPLLEPFYGKPLCICGIGNPDTPADSLGPETARRIMPHFYEAVEIPSNFSKVAVICPGVFGKTNLSTETVISSVAKAMNAACVLTIDACVTQDVDRLCSTIQLTDTGMDNQWKLSSLRQSTLGVPVISVGVPTVIPISALLPERKTPDTSQLTPTHIVDIIDVASFIIACAITQVVYPDIDHENCRKFIEVFAHNIPPVN